MVAATRSPAAAHRPWRRTDEERAACDQSWKLTSTIADPLSEPAPALPPARPT